MYTGGYECMYMYLCIYTGGCGSMYMCHVYRWLWMYVHVYMYTGGYECMYMYLCIQLVVDLYTCVMYTGGYGCMYMHLCIQVAMDLCTCPSPHQKTKSYMKSPEFGITHHCTLLVNKDTRYLKHAPLTHPSILGSKKIVV